MSTPPRAELATLTDSVPSRAEEIRSAVAQVESLLEALPPDEASEALGDARAKAEAASLLARRMKNAEQERHFGKLRLLAEAGLGILSFDGYGVDATDEQVKVWRTLAAGFERGKLLACCEQSTSTREVAAEIRRRGLTYVPRKALPASTWEIAPNMRTKYESWTWADARRICRARGIDPTSVPPDADRIRREAATRAKAARATAEDARRYRETKRRRRIARAADDYPEIAEAYSLIRQALDALGKVTLGDVPRDRKLALNKAFDHLYRAEDAIAQAVRLDS